MRNDLKSAVVCIVGLGYVGLPLAKAFSKSLKVIGFDTDDQKIKQLSQRGSATLTFTTDSKQIGKADFIIITVPSSQLKSLALILVHSLNLIPEYQSMLIIALSRSQ